MFYTVWIILCAALPSIAAISTTPQTTLTPEQRASLMEGYPLQQLDNPEEMEKWALKKSPELLNELMEPSAALKRLGAQYPRIAARVAQECGSSKNLLPDEIKYLQPWYEFFQFIRHASYTYAPNCTKYSPEEDEIVIYHALYLLHHTHEYTPLRAKVLFRPKFNLSFPDILLCLAHGIAPIPAADDFAGSAYWHAHNQTFVGPQDLSIQHDTISHMTTLLISQQVGEAFILDTQGLPFIQKIAQEMLKRLLVPFTDTEKKCFPDLKSPIDIVPLKIISFFNHLHEIVTFIPGINSQESIISSDPDFACLLQACLHQQHYSSLSTLTVAGPSFKQRTFEQASQVAKKTWSNSRTNTATFRYTELVQAWRQIDPSAKHRLRGRLANNLSIYGALWDSPLCMPIFYSSTKMLFMFPKKTILKKGSPYQRWITHQSILLSAETIESFMPQLQNPSSLQNRHPIDVQGDIQEFYIKIWGCSTYRIPHDSSCVS